MAIVWHFLNGTLRGNINITFLWHHEEHSEFRSNHHTVVTHATEAFPRLYLMTETPFQLS